MRRACSSPFSLALSLERRMALLLENPADSLDQLTLPFIDKESDEEPGSELEIPGLRDSSEEVRWLQRLIQLARTASLRESKIHTLRRLIQRAREPVLVFTEYRETLRHLSTALVDFAPLGLHGGLTTRERAGVLRQFTAGPHCGASRDRCGQRGTESPSSLPARRQSRLPWTPQRLEQRIGRVDRLGQHRRVHSVRLVAMNTREESMGTRLDERAERIHAAFDTPGSVNAAALSNDAGAEATRLLAARSLSLTQPRSMSSDRPFVTSIKTHSGGTSRIWAFRLSCVDDAGHVLFETVAGLRDQRCGFRIDEELDRIATPHYEYVLATTSAAIASWLDLATRREEAIARALRESHARLSAVLLQPGLFGRHAERAAAAQTSRVDEAVAKSHARLTMLDRAPPPGARRTCGRFWRRIPPMIAGVRGRLITASFADTELPAITGNCVAPPDAVRALEEWSARRDATFGPASSVRAIADGIALPLLKILGFTAGRRVDGSDCARLEAVWRGTPLIPVTVIGWDQPLDAAWRVLTAMPSARTSDGLSS